MSALCAHGRDRRRDERSIRLDALVAPTQGPVWLIDLVNGDGGGGTSFTQPAAVAGYPHITVPMGLVQGLPVGLSFVRPRLERANVVKARLFVRTGVEDAAPANVRGIGDAERVVRGAWCVAS